MDPAAPPVQARPVPPFKRAMDIALSLIGIVLTSPLSAAVALAIKLDDGGPVFYRQKRWGRGGRVFELLKFRSMRRDSDALFGINPAAADDPRVTRVGRLLRATGMDEIPQFINILKGDMSFVGPRALAVEERLFSSEGEAIDLVSLPGFSERMTVLPGLTGASTIYLPKDASAEKKLERDLEYIQNYSLWHDLRLIATSISISLRGRWETRESKTRITDRRPPSKRT